MASEIRVNKINSRTGVGTITLSPTGVDFTGIATVATLKATTGIVTTFSATGNATVGGTLGVTGETTFATHVNFGDNDKAIFGSGSDLQIYHDTSGAGNSIIKEEGTGELRLGSNNAVRITKHDSETCALFTIDGAAELYYDNTKKFETKSDGVDITGELQCDTLDVDGNIDLDGSKITFDSGGNVLKWADNVAAYFGDGNDLRIYHDSSNSWITDNGTGSLKIRSTAGSVQILGTTSNDNMAVFTVDGASELYYDNSKKFETTTNGVTVTGRVQCDEVRAGDDDKIQLGDSQDFRVYHDGSTNIIDGHYHPIELRHQSEVHAKFVDDGAVELYHNNVKKFETKSDGVVVTGGIYLDGSGGTGSANKLDDYEEGGWTPTISFGGNSFNGTYSTNQGFYTKIGRLVNVSCELSLSSKGTTTGGLRIDGLPFTPYNDDESRASGVVGYHQDTSSINFPIQILIEHNQTDFPLRDASSPNSDSIDNTNVGNGFRIYFTITYMTS